MSKIHTGQDVIYIYDNFVRQQQLYPFRGNTSLSSKPQETRAARILLDIISSETAVEMKKTEGKNGAYRSLDMNRIFLNWVTGYIARGGRIGIVHKADEDSLFQNYLHNYHVSLAGRILTPAVKASMPYCIVLPGGRDQINVFAGARRSSFLHFDDFSAGRTGRHQLFIELPYSISKWIIGPVEKQGLWDHHRGKSTPVHQRPPSRQAEILLRAGVDLGTFMRCVGDGKDPHLVKANYPLPSGDPDFDWLREEAQRFAQRMGQPQEKLHPDVVQFSPPPRRGNNGISALEIFKLVCQRAQKKPKALAGDLFGDALNILGSSSRRPAVIREREPATNSIDNV